MAAKKFATIILSILRKQKGSYRFDADKSAENPIIGNSYIDKVALLQNFQPPKAGMIPGKVQVTVEVLDWVDAETVPTAEEEKARREAKRTAQAA